MLIRKRRSNDTLQYKQYRKQYDSWAICDYSEVGTTFHQFYQSMIKWAEIRRQELPTKKEARNLYRKIYLAK